MEKKNGEEKMRFIDLFAGVGGFRLGLERNGHTCVWSSEIDKYCNQVYKYHWGEIDAKDIRDVRCRDIPDFDMLCGGFPCQAFSVAGKRRGFQDTRGTLFFEIARILESKRPSYLFLENVKGLLNHEKGQTFTKIIQTLDELGYDCQWMVLNSKFFGVPQNRERVFIIGNLAGTRRPEILPFGKNEGVSPITTGTRPRQSQAKHSGTLNPNLRATDTFVIHSKRQSDEVRIKTESPTLTKYWGEGGGNVPLVVDPEKEDKHCPTCICDKTDEVLNPNPEETDDHCETCICNKKPIAIQDAGTFSKSQRGSGIKRDDCMFTLKAKARPHGIAITHNTVTEAVGNRAGSSKEYLTSVEKVNEALMIRDGRDNHSCLRSGRSFEVGISGMSIRRLTPVECERLQGFPDDWTAVGMDEDGNEVKISDTQRYKMMGNAVTVNVIEAVGSRFNGL